MWVARCELLAYVLSQVGKEHRCNLAGCWADETRATGVGLLAEEFKTPGWVVVVVVVGCSFTFNSSCGTRVRSVKMRAIMNCDGCLRDSELKLFSAPGLVGSVTGDEVAK